MRRPYEDKNQEKDDKFGKDGIMFVRYCEEGCDMANVRDRFKALDGSIIKFGGGQRFIK